MKNRRTIIIILSCVLFIIITGLCGYVYFSTEGWNNLMYPNTQIEDIDVSGKTKDEAEKIVSDKINSSIKKYNLVIKTPDKSYSMNFGKFNIKYDIHKTVETVFKHGRNENMFKRYNLIYKSKAADYKIKINYDFSNIKQMISIIQKDVDKSPVNASLSFSNGNINISSSSNGQKLDSDKLENEIENQIKKSLYKQVTIKAPITVTKPTITKDELNLINTKVSSFSTDYSGSSAERANNIELATKTINGIIVMPGKEFSFNTIVGQRTAEKGYKSAPVIVGNKVDSGLGGGICQVSTTLYNAVVRADIKASVRIHHTLPSHYIGIGMDATVDYDSGTDYKFINTLSYPIYIEGYTANGQIFFNVYSNSSLTSKTYNLSSDVYATIQPSVQYIDDSSIPNGQTSQEQAASTGYKVKVYLDTYQNGTLLSHEQISDDFYQPVNEIIRRGTKQQ